MKRWIHAATNSGSIWSIKFYKNGKYTEEVNVLAKDLDDATQIASDLCEEWGSALNKCVIEPAYKSLDWWKSNEGKIKTARGHEYI